MLSNVCYLCNWEDMRNFSKYTRRVHLPRCRSWEFGEVRVWQPRGMLLPPLHTQHCPLPKVLWRHMVEMISRSSSINRMRLSKMMYTAVFVARVQHVWPTSTSTRWSDEVHTEGFKKPASTAICMPDARATEAPPLDSSSPKLSCCWYQRTHHPLSRPEAPKLGIDTIPLACLLGRSKCSPFFAPAVVHLARLSQ